MTTPAKKTYLLQVRDAARFWCNFGEFTDKHSAIRVAKVGDFRVDGREQAWPRRVVEDTPQRTVVWHGEGPSDFQRFSSVI